MERPKASIIVPCLNSHEPFRRNMIYLSRILPHDVEMIVVDDESWPILEIPKDLKFACPTRVMRTWDDRPWTNLLAYMRGAEEASSDNIVIASVDHVFTSEAIEWAKGFTGHRANFMRKMGFLDENGILVTDKEELRKVCGHPGVLRKFVNYVETDEITLAPPYIINRTRFLTDCGYSWEMHENWPDDQVEAQYRMMTVVKDFLDRCDRLMNYHPKRWFSQRAPEDCLIYTDPRCNTDYFHNLRRL